VAGGGEAPGAIDLLQDDARLGDAEPGAAVLLRDERGQPAGVGQRLHERIGIAVGAVQLAPVLIGEGAVLVGQAEVHAGAPSWATLYYPIFRYPRRAGWAAGLAPLSEGHERAIW